jgi:hypothetical protein
MAVDLLSAVWRVFCLPPKGYTYANKKDDDDSQAERLLQVWQEAFPVSTRHNELGYENEKKYCIGLMKGLKEVPITSKTLDKIQAHFLKIAEQSNLMWMALLASLKDGKATFMRDEIRMQIHDAVAWVVPRQA